MSANNKPKKQLDHRPTIGVIIDSMGSSYQISLWRGIKDAARNRDINLICFLGSAIGSSENPQQANAIYRLINENNFDGLIILTGTIGYLVNHETLEAYLQQFQPLPTVSIATELSNIPSILLDNQRGIKDIVKHLIETHNYHRIGFVCMSEGYQEGDDRFQAYKDTLAEYGIPYDPQIVVPGEYYDNAEGAVRLLYDERKVSLEAIVAVDDYMALPIMEALKNRGFAIPQDVAIVGFDDVEETRFTDPPLTTIQQPLWEEAQQAVDMILTCLTGDTVPLKVTLLPTPVVRDSCGCLQISITQEIAPIGVQDAVTKPLSEYHDQILNRIIEASDIKKEQPIKELLIAFTKALENEEPETFIQTLKSILLQVERRNEDPQAWQSVISTLRMHVIHIIQDKNDLATAENMIHQARMLISKVAQQEQANLRFKSQQQSLAFHNLSQGLSVITDLKDLYNIVDQEIPHLGISEYSITLYDQSNPEADSFLLVLARNQAGLADLPPEGLAYPSEDLLPEGFIPKDERFTKVIEPILFGEDQYGFVILDDEAFSESVYDPLAEQISSGVKRVRVVQGVSRRAVQQTTASEVSRAASSILNPDELIRMTVELIRDRFDLYYAGIFLVDDERQWAILRSGSGEPGKNMLAENWRLKIGGNSMIGHCIATGEPDIQPDVDKAPVHLRNPHLPKTKSELALPLLSRGEILGAVTIQSEVANAFSNEDIAVLQTMANQLATAIGNAYLYDALAQEQYLITAMMDNMPEAIYFKDRESRFLRISRYMLDRFGVGDPSEVIGKTDFDFFSEEHARAAYENEQHILKTGEPLLNIEELETWEDRPSTWVLTSKLPLQNERGKIVGTFGISRDITERKEAQLTLQRQSNQLQTAIDVSRAVSEILEPESLSQQVVELIRERFNLYYVGIFLVDETGEQAVLQAGTGTAGKRMIAEGWHLEVGGQSMVGRCIELGIPDLQLDVDQAPAHLRNPHLPETKSEIALPLFSRGRVLGALTIQSDQEGAFTTQDATVLQTMANQVATAIANAQLFEQTQSALLETETLLNVARLVSSAVAIEESLADVLDLTLKATGIDAGLFSLIDLETNQLKLIAHQIPEPLLNKLLSDGLEGTLCDHVRQRRAPIISYDLATDSPIDASGLIQLGFKSYQGVPIEARGEIFGTFCTFNNDVLEPDESNITVLQAIGQQVGVAISNARLFQQTQAALAELESTQRRYQIQAWSSYNQRRESSGYMQNAEGIKPIGKRKISEVNQAIQRQAPVISENKEQPTLTVPIMLRDQPIGAVGVQAGQGKRQWSLEEISLVQEISEQFALAAESLRLLDETQRRAARERLVGEITTKLRATNDPQTILHTAVKELKEVLNAKRAQVFVQNQPSKEDKSDSSTTAEVERGDA